MPRPRRTAPSGRTAHARGAAPLAAALAVLAVLSLVGCDPRTVGAAAVVDGDRISTNDIQDAVQQVRAVAPAGGLDEGVAQRRILERRLSSAVIADVARREGVTVAQGQVDARMRSILDEVRRRAGDTAPTSDEQLRDELTRALLQQQPPTVVPPDELDSWLRDGLLVEAIATKLGGGEQGTQAAYQQLVTRARAMSVEVNPRYGTWDPEKGLTALVSGGLSKTAEELSGSGSGSAPSEQPTAPATP